MAAFDLDAYLRRIDYQGELKPNLETLRGLQFAHRCTVPFENLDIHMGVPISLEMPHLFDKIVTRRRGGYCFEQNVLFMNVLSVVGFTVVAREARVGPSDGPASPRSHMTLEVPIDGVDYNVDVGFGGDASLQPVAIDGEEHAEFGRLYRVVQAGEQHVLQVSRDEAWADSYVIQAGEPSPVDFEVANWYTSTHPRSRFVRTPTAQLRHASGQSILRRRNYTETRDGVDTNRELSDDEIMSLLPDVFGLELGPDVRLIDFGGHGDP